MTERQGPRRRGPDRITVALLAGTAFLLVFTFLVIQLSNAASRPKAIVVRRIYETKVIERVSGAGAGGTSVTQSSSAPYASTYGAVATGSSR